jgi:hypothetical protein
MDHNDAVRLQAAEKYVLGEFPTNLRDEYEEHFFDCAECAVDVKAIAAFVDTTRELLRQEALVSVEKAAATAGGDRQALPASSGWRVWLQPVLVPAFAALLVLAGYQNFVSIPRWKEAAGQSAKGAAREAGTSAQAAQAVAPRVLATFSLLAANRRGGGRPVVHARPGESFVLKFDITDPDPSASSSYLLLLEDSSGTTHVLGMVSREEAQNTLFVEVPADFPTGNAKLVVQGVAPSGANPPSGREITSIPFVVAFGPDIEHHPQLPK